MPCGWGKRFVYGGGGWCNHMDCPSSTFELVDSTHRVKYAMPIWPESRALHNLDELQTGLVYGAMGMPPSLTFFFMHHESSN